MKNILNAVIDEARNLVIAPSEGFAGEHNAEVLEIDIGPFASEGYDYFILNFENFCAGGKLISNIIRTENDEPSYIANGVICCPLTAQLTASGKLRLQLEAHKSTDSGEIVKKSSVAQLSFKPSVMGADDLMNSGGTFHTRLDEVEQDIDALGKRLDGIRVEEYGERIEAAEETAQTASETAQALGGRVDILEAESVQTKGRLETVEGYKIPENFASIGERVQALEEKPDGLDTIPLASEKSVGGVMLDATAPVKLDENGALDIHYANLNQYTLASLFALALITESGSVETIAGESSETVATFVYDNAMYVAMDSLRAVAFTVFNRSKVEYITEDYEIAEINAEANHVYVIGKKDGKMTVDDYYGTDLRRLIMEGI